MWPCLLRGWLMIYGGMSPRAMCRYSQFSECEAVDTAAGEVTGLYPTHRQQHTGDNSVGRVALLAVQ